MTSLAAPESAAPVVSLTPVRDIRPGAHQVLLVGNGRDTFYVVEIQRAIAGEVSPLARFLPRANYIPGDRTAGKPARVVFEMDATDVAAARPLRSSGPSLPGALALTRSEIDAFRRAVQEFQTPAADLTPLQQQCRRDFRLPDPAREPDAYWVVGTGFERRLIILWGCERFARTSVSLDRVVAHLETCALGPDDKQQLGLELALRRDEPLSRFLVLPAKNRAGFRRRGEGDAIPAKALKRFVHFGRAEFEAFNAAAVAFMAKAGEADTSGFESEIRREFVLPSLAKMPERFFRRGAHLLINAAPFDRAHGVPPAPLDDQQEEDAEAPPLNRQLARRVKFQRWPIAVGAGALGAIAAVVTIFLLFGPDRKAPTFVGVEAPSSTEVAVTFSEPLPDTIPADAIAFVGDARRIAEVRRDPADAARLIIVPETAFADGESYALDLTEGLTDRAGNPLPRTTAEFQFLDNQPPQLVARTGISAGGRSARDLVLTFDQPIDPASLTPSALSIRPVSSGESGRAVRIDRVEFDPDVPDGSRIIVTAEEEFQSRRPYQLSVRDLRDRAIRSNRVQLEDHPFEYRDVLPPNVREVVATGATYTLHVQFSKPVDPETALAPEAYQVLAPSSEGPTPLRLLEGGLSLDETGSRLTLRLERAPLSPGQHTLVVNDAADRQGNRLELPIERPFAFSDAGTRGAPRISQRPVADEQSNVINLIFDRGLSPAAANDASRYRILNADGVESGLTVSQAASPAEDSRRVTLTLSGRPVGGALYYVRTEGLEDIFGTLQTEPDVAEFRAVTTTIRPTLTLQLADPPQRLDDSRVVVRFSDVMVAESVEEPANYRVLPATPVERVEHAVKTEQNRPYSEVTLHFNDPLPSEVRIGANNLAIEGDASGQTYRLTPRPARM